MERAIVHQHVDAVKTIYSQRTISIDPVILEALHAAGGKQPSSRPTRTGCLAARCSWDDCPFLIPGFGDVFSKPPPNLELESSALTPCGTVIAHGWMRWGPIAVQQKLMRHTDIRTTLNMYGDVVTDEMAQANSKSQDWR